MTQTGWKRATDTDEFRRVQAWVQGERDRLQQRYGGPAPADTDAACSTCHGARSVLTQRVDIAAGIYETETAPCPNCAAPGLEQRQQTAALGESGLERYRRVTFGAMPAKVGQEAYWQYGEDWAREPHGTLYFYGSFATGKSTLARCIGNQRYDQGDRVVLRDVRSLLDELRGSYDDGAEVRFEARFGSLARADLLILDDFGQETPTEWALEKLGRLLWPRFDAGTPLVLTSNRAPAWLATAGGPERAQLFYHRLYSRIMNPELTLALAFTNPPITGRSHDRGMGEETSSGAGKRERANR